MKYVNIPVPEEYLDEVAEALVGVAKTCPRHGDRCQKVLMVIDSCQLEMLKLVELVVHGEVTIDIADGRPADIHYWLDVEGVKVRQDFRASKDGIQKARALINLLRTTSAHAIELKK